MIIAPLSKNLLPTASVLTSASAFEVGWPATNLWDADPRRPAVLRGMFTVVAGVNDKVDFNDGSVKAATLTAGTYYNAAEAAVELARALNAAGSGFAAMQLQGSASRFCWRITHAGVNLLNASGANAATSALVLLFGFPAVDTGSAASHTGAYAAACGGSLETGDRVVMDLGSAMAVGASFVAAPGVSPGGMIFFGHGSATTSHSHYHHGDCADDEVLFADLSSVWARLRYASLAVFDPKRTERARASIGYWYAGPAINTIASTLSDGINYELGSFSRALVNRASERVGKSGVFFADEVRPGETVSVAFGSNPGLGPGELPALREVAMALGQESLAFVAFDSWPLQAGTAVFGEHTRLSRLCRVVSAPEIREQHLQTKAGRYSMSLTFEIQAVS